MTVQDFHKPLFFNSSAMNVYQNIANTNPDAANEVCKKYGYYQIRSIDELAYSLQCIVADEGESSLKEIMQLHPDKDVILELFETKCEENPVIMEKKDCSCMMNADGASSTTSGIASQTNMIILVAAMIVSISIISMKK
jgi:hypothetical protein